MRRLGGAAKSSTPTRREIPDQTNPGMSEQPTSDRDKPGELTRAKNKQPDQSGTDGASDSEPGAPVPFDPDSDEDSPLGDTDEHSDA